MNPDEAADRDAEFLRRLVAYEEALAAGGLPPPADAATPPGLAERLQRAQACVRRLRRDRRPADAPAPPDISPLMSGAGLAFDPAGGLTCLGRFEIIRELGRGGCGIVYLARDPLLGREVALKVPRLEALVTPELRRRFLREARLAADIDHPNVVAVHEAGEVGPVCYLVSAYCPGKTLAAWLQEQPGPVPTDVVAALVATLAEAVHHVHGRGILHRDLKPANILMRWPTSPSRRTAKPWPGWNGSRASWSCGTRSPAGSGSATTPARGPIWHSYRMAEPWSWGACRV